VLHSEITTNGCRTFPSARCIGCRASQPGEYQISLLIVQGVAEAPVVAVCSQVVWTFLSIPHITVLSCMLQPLMKAAPTAVRHMGGGVAQVYE